MASDERKQHPYSLLIDALRLLPVQPMKARAELGEARHSAKHNGKGALHGVAVLLKDLDELFIEEEPGAPRISPKGAQLLLKLYRQGVLEVAEKRPDEDGAEILEAYAQGKASIVGAGFWTRPPRRKPQRAVASLFETDVSIVRKFATLYERTYSITTHVLR
jgi:hypothetical protein